MTATIVLRPIEKIYATTLRARTGMPMRRECWEAVTIDGLWAFERIEDVGTPWIVVYKPRTPDAETCFQYFGTLKSARLAVEHGWVKSPSLWIAEHAQGLHDRVWSPCRDCRKEEPFHFDRPSR